MASTSDVTDLYRGRLATGNAALLARIGALWSRAFNPLDPAGSLPMIGTIVGRWLIGAQVGAAAEATQYMSALLSASTSIPIGAIEPLGVPSGLVGKVMNGSTVMQYLRQAPAVYFNRIGKGYSDDLAAASTLSWLNKTAGSEPYRVANQTVAQNATDDDRYSGRVRRITRNNACDFCITIADRGYIPSHADFEAHAHCQCTPEPEISSHVTSRSGIRRAMEAEARRQAKAAREPAPPEGELDLRGFDNSGMRAVGARAITLNSLDHNFENIRPEIRDRLRAIEASGAEDPAFKEHPEWVAFFDPADNTIHLRPREYGEQAIWNMKGQIEKGWWSDDGKAKTSADRTLTHEIGHFLDAQLTRDESLDLRWKLGSEAGVQSMTEASWMVSEYGSKNDKELIAEAWAEYKTSPNPRAPAMVVGKYLEDKLGTNPSPTKPAF